MDRSMSLMSSFLALCIDAPVIKMLGAFEWIINMVVSDGESPVVVFVFDLIKPEITSVFLLLLNTCNDMKLIYLDLVCRKELPFTKINPFLFPLCGGVWQWEVIRVSSWLFCYDLVSFRCSCLVWWVFVVLIWLLIGWCHWGWSGISYFFFNGLFKRLLNLINWYFASLCSLVVPKTAPDYSTLPLKLIIDGVFGVWLKYPPCLPCPW